MIYKREVAALFQLSLIRLCLNRLLFWKATFFKMDIGKLECIYIRKGEGMKLNNVPMLNLERERQHGDGWIAYLYSKIISAVLEKMGQIFFVQIQESPSVNIMEKQIYIYRINIIYKTLSSYSKQNGLSQKMMNSLERNWFSESIGDITEEMRVWTDVC